MQKRQTEIIHYCCQISIDKTGFYMAMVHINSYINAKK